MNWSSKWPDAPSELDKAEADVRLFGTGFIKDGKHIAPEDVYIDIGKGDDISILTIMEGNKQRAIHAQIIGDLALDFNDDGWNIYHVPTLACFSKAVPGYSKPLEDQTKSYSKNEIICELSFEYDRDQLLNWMAKVQEQYSTNWTMLRCLTPENYKDKGGSAKQIILDWCLSVKVE